MICVTKENKPARREEKYMRLALDQAGKAFARGEVPIGAIVVFKDKVIGRAHNRRESSRNPLSHAEIAAIIKGARKLKNFRLQDCEIYVTLEPCILCLGAILQSRIKRLIFALRNPKEGAAGLLPSIRRKLHLNYNLEIKSGVLACDSERLLKSFFTKVRKARQ
jgi:tRNA(adenine34) deaminase